MVIGYDISSSDKDTEYLGDVAFYYYGVGDSLGYEYGEEPFHKIFPCPWEEISYYNPDTLWHVIGIWGGEPPYYWSSAIRLTQDELAPYYDWSFSRVIVALSCEEQSEVYANLTIYGEGTPTEPGDIIYQDTGLYFNTTGFHTIELNEHIPFKDHDEIWFAMTWNQTEEGIHIPYCDDGPAVDGKGDWIYLNNMWQEMQPDIDKNWAMGAIVAGEGKAELQIINIKGPIGVNAEIKNAGEVDANNLEYTMTVTGGILGLIDKGGSGGTTTLAPGATEAIGSGLILGFGKIAIEITANADNAAEVTAKKEAFVLGLLVIGIK